ncbi:uncharacterized protein LOC126997834 isoform X10 [Eriocheir sinensis]|uniref:uncharacterized protein LOC126997834 isoform X9 n=1 Tax=Eriocheir sinensis TaxID=95602 RepID=UPI0021C82F7B|nr:uncharacterized protein LOC126997834 isoform X9 [Eriocheir sinensis]XP_050715008.1 uncharacterized protein LOC126997834 isoform X10 [Eriocheir sinensis]
MNTRLSLLMVFLVIVATPGASLSPDLDARCPASTTISGDDEWAKIGTWQNLTHGWGWVLYLHPDPGFKGVRLVAKGDDGQHDAWFTLDNTCFPRDAQWWRLWAGLWRSRNDDNNTVGFLDLGVQTGGCRLRCHRGLLSGVMNLTFEAHGPSRWRFKNPTPCTEEGYKRQGISWKKCTSHPTTTTTTTTSTTTLTTTITTNNNSTTIPTTTITTTIPTTITTTTTLTTTITIIVVPVIAVVFVVVVLVVTKCYRQRRVKPDVRMRFQGAPAANKSVVVENSLYETFEDTRRTEVVENSLYETLDNTRGTEVVENSLYETLDNTRGTEVVENSLYETLDNTRGTEVVENSLYEALDNTRGTEVVENSLYETLDNTRGTEVVENSLYETFENVRKPR